MSFTTSFTKILVLGSLFTSCRRDLTPPVTDRDAPYKKVILIDTTGDAANFPNLNDPTIAPFGKVSFILESGAIETYTLTDAADPDGLAMSRQIDKPGKPGFPPPMIDRDSDDSTYTPIIGGDVSHTDFENDAFSTNKVFVLRAHAGQTITRRPTLDAVIETNIPNVLRDIVGPPRYPHQEWVNDHLPSQGLSYRRE